jgi:competence protein ComEA
MRRLLLLGIAVLSLGVGLAAVAPSGQGSKGKSASAKAAVATPAAPVNLNTATAAQIETLPGIGPKAAQRIIEYRQKNGGFKKIEELMNVKGIGEKSFLKLKPLVVVSSSSAEHQAGKQ